MIASHILLRVEYRSIEIYLKKFLSVCGPFFLYIEVMFAVIQRVGYIPCLKIFLNNFAIGFVICEPVLSCRVFRKADGMPHGDWSETFSPLIWGPSSYLLV